MNECAHKTFYDPPFPHCYISCVATVASNMIKDRQKTTQITVPKCDFLEQMKNTKTHRLSLCLYIYIKKKNTIHNHKGVKYGDMVTLSTLASFASSRQAIQPGHVFFHEYWSSINMTGRAQVLDVSCISCFCHLVCLPDEWCCWP